MRHLPTLIATVLLTSGALAFGTIEGLGQSSEHERITRFGLKEAGIGPETMAALAGERGAFGAPGYPQSAAAAETTLKACRDFTFASLVAAVGRIVPELTLMIGEKKILEHIPCAVIV